MRRSSSRTRFAKIRFPVLIIFKMPCPQHRESWFRYPSYFALNAGAEKRFPFRGYQWAVRLSVINATGHNNYSSVINNVDAPNFLMFSGGQHRAFTARLRFVGRR